MDRPAFVVGASWPGLGAIQSLRMKGVPCFALDSRRSIGTHSRYASYQRIPDPRQDGQAMIERIIDLARRSRHRPVVIPADDHYAQALAAGRDDIEEVASVCVASADVVNLLIRKARFYEWAESEGLSCPAGVPAAEFGAGSALDFPIVVKSRRRALDIDFKDSNRFYLRFELLRNAREWREYCASHAAYLADLLVQEFVPGTTADMYSIGIYADRQSQIRGLFVGRKIRGFPAIYGDTRAGQNDSVPGSVLAEVRYIVHRLGYCGIAEFEYKRDVKSGRFRLIEVNPRCWSWVGITTASLADIPWIAYQDLIGSAPQPVTHNRDPGSIKYARILWDLSDVLLRHRSGHRAWAMSPLQWWKSLRAEKLVAAEFTRNDWPVALWSILFIIGSAFRLAWRQIGRASRLLIRPTAN